MYSFIARQPILNKDMSTVAYELLFRNGMNNKFPNVSPEFATTELISDNFLCIPAVHTVGKNIAFINVPHQLIINGLSDTLPCENVMIEILEDAEPDDELFSAVKNMHSLGYHFALDDFTLEDKWDRFLSYISVIKFDVIETSQTEIINYINSKKYLLGHIKFLAEKIETQEEFNFFKSAGFSYFQGYFFSRPEVIKNKRLSPNTLILNRLMVETCKAETDFTAIENILKSDLTLSYKIMRHVKNMLFKIHGMQLQDNFTLREVLLYLGSNEIRKFVSVAVLANIAGKGVGELYHTSLIRGKFCELVALKKNQYDLSYNAFVCGLFSLLDALLEMPMEDLIEQIILPKNVSEALCEKKGTLFEILSMVKSYECYDWIQTTKLCSMLNIPEFAVIEIMQKSMKWADEQLVG
jgi:EAL and modified HD-GYP domain-containing signal transduction protein